MGIIRHIEDASEAGDAYEKAGEQAIDGGFGYFRVLSDYVDEMSFDQDIKIVRIDNRFSVALGPHRLPDASDCKEAVVWEDIPLDDFKTEYPNAEEVGFEDSDDWGSKDMIRIAEYMCIKPEKTNIHQLEDGSVIEDEELREIQKLYPEFEPTVSRETIKNKVKWYKVTGHEVLDKEDMLGTYIPVIKVVGEETTMPDGKIRLSGAIEPMMDPQRIHNYAHAGFIENVALAPRAPWVAADAQVEDYEDEYAQANRKNIAVLKYKPVSEEGHLLPSPQRTPPPGMSTGWQAAIQNTREAIEGAAGMYGPTVGSTSQEKSGIALREQKEQGMVGNFHFPDNLSKSIQHCGRILLEWIPKIYDADRVARMLGEDGDVELAFLNQDQEQAVMPRMDQMGQKVGNIYNLNVGRYDVTVSTGPSYTAKRQEAAEMQMEMLSKMPDMLQIFGDIMFKNLDTPGSDEIAKRLETMLPPEIRQLEDEDEEVDPKVRAMMDQMDQAMAQIEEKAQVLAQAEQELTTRAQETDSDKAAVSADQRVLSAQKTAFESKVREEMAKMELLGRTLVDNIEDVVEPVALQLAQTEQTEEEAEPTVAPVMQQILMAINETTAQTQLKMVDAVNSAMERMSEALTQGLNAPRETTLLTDNDNNPIGSTSRVVPLDS
jgi:hypothetical protein